jgi:hypothetical protein
MINNSYNSHALNMRVLFTTHWLTFPNSVRSCVPDSEGAVSTSLTLSYESVALFVCEYIIATVVSHGQTL